MKRLNIFFLTVLLSVASFAQTVTTLPTDAGSSKAVIDTNFTTLQQNKLQYQGAYSGTTSYNKSDTVLSLGVWYVSLQTGNIGNLPIASPTWWTPVMGVAVFNGTPNQFLATDPSGSSTNPAALRAMVLADLPSTVVNTGSSYSNPAWLSSLAWSKVTGAPATQAPITGAPGTWPTFAPSATTDTTNASNINSGTLNHARLPSLLSGDIPNNTANTSGTAAALAATPTLCLSGQAPTGVLTNGNATGCAPIGGSGMVYPGAGTPTSTGSAWGASLPAHGPGICAPTVSSGALTFTDTKACSVFAYTLNSTDGNITSGTLSGFVSGQTYILDIVADGTRTWTWPATVPSAPPFVNIAGNHNVYPCKFDGTNCTQASGISSSFSACTPVAAPVGNPPVGQLYVWCDGTGGHNRWMGRDSSGNNTGLALDVAAVPHSFATSMVNGVMALMQPAFPDLSDAIASAKVVGTSSGKVPVAATAGDVGSIQYVAGGGSANAQTVTLSPAVTTLVSGLSVKWLPVAANTASANLAVNGLTATAITKCGTSALAANDLTTGAVAVVTYDGTQFQLQNPQAVTCGSASGGGIADPGANGVMNRTSLNVTGPAKATDIEAPRIATSAGSANAYVLTLSPAITAYTGACFEFISNFANTGAATINVNGLGAKNITKQGASAVALASGDIANGQTVSVCYDGTQLEMQSQLGNAPSGGAATSMITNIGTVTLTNPTYLHIGAHVATLFNTIDTDFKTGMGTGSTYTPGAGRVAVCTSALAYSTGAPSIYWEVKHSSTYFGFSPSPGFANNSVTQTYLWVLNAGDNLAVDTVGGASASGDFWADCIETDTNVGLKTVFITGLTVANDNVVYTCPNANGCTVLSNTGQSSGVVSSWQTGTPTYTWKVGPSGSLKTFSTPAASGANTRQSVALNYQLAQNDEITCNPTTVQTNQMCSVTVIEH